MLGLSVPGDGVATTAWVPPNVGLCECDNLFCKFGCIDPLWFVCSTVQLL